MAQKNIIYGVHSVKSILLHNEKRISIVYKQHNRQDQRLEELLDLAKNKHISIKLCSSTELDSLTKNGNHQGIVASCETIQKYYEADLLPLIQQTPHATLLVLDGVTDPHNLGACLRVADATKVTVVITPKDHAVGLTPTVYKVASGAAENIPFIQVTNLARTLKTLRNEKVWIYGADETAKTSLYECEFTEKIALVMGSEDQGLRRLTREHCDFLISLPMLGTVSSLNVSVATGICLYEIMRQRS